jgi:hypothetical protein
MSTANQTTSHPTGTNGPEFYNHNIITTLQNLDIMLPSAARIHEVEEQADSAITAAGDFLLALHNEAIYLRTQTLISLL